MSERDVFGDLDDPLWQADADYSAAIATILRETAPILAAQRTRGRVWQTALQRLTRSVHRPMAAHQRQRVCYLLGRAAAAGLDHQRAVIHFEKALQLALGLDDVNAVAASAQSLAAAHWALQRFGAAVSALEVCAVMLGAVGCADSVVPPALLVRTEDTMLALATLEYVRGHFEAAERWLDQADALVPRLADKRAASSASAATHALLARARGKPEVALRHALVALDLAEVGRDATLGWVRGLIVECALDLAELLAGGPAGAAGRALLALAHGYVDDSPRLPKAGRRHGEAPPHLLADGVIYLASVRYLRLADAADTAERLTAFERLIAIAERYDNKALLGLAFTALGDDLAACGAQRPALRSYEAAHRAIDGLDMAGFGLRAQRALLRHREAHLEG